MDLAKLKVADLKAELAARNLDTKAKRVDTPVRRRSTRRSMTRSPSPTNTTGENPHASLMGSARKRGRSRSMTKSPSPQRVTSEAPCLASVQEEPEPTIGTEQRLAGAKVPAEVTPVSIEDSLPAKVEESIAPPVEDAPLAPTLDELDSLLESDEQSDLLKGSVMEVDEGDSLAESELLESDCEEEKADEKTEEKTEGKTEETQSTDVAEVTAAPVDETPATGDQDTAAINDDTKVNAEEPPKSVEQSETDTTTATESAAAEDKPNVESSNAVEKKQTSAQQAQNTMVEFVSEENEPQLATETDSTVTLSWYDSDLNLAIDDQDLLSAKPLTDGIFGLVWAGVRATRGVLGGKVFYEVLVADELQPATRSPLIPEGEKTTPELRIGWSTGIAGARQLGETDHSYGYASSGKKVVGGNFEEYGVAYGKNDVVGVYLDLESTPCRMEFTTNVFASEQKRRLKGFGGFKTRRAVAVVPSVEEYKRRYELKVAKYGKEVPDTTLNTMKANIFVPSLVQNWYTELLFPELPEAEAQEAIKKLNEEGRKLLPPRRNRANQSNRQKHNNNANNNYTSRWNHNRPGQGGQQQYGKNRYGGAGGAPTGGYNRYGGHKVNEGAQQQYGHHRGGDYRSGGGNGYGRRDDHHHRGGNYGGGGGNRYDSWTRNSDITTIVDTPTVAIINSQIIPTIDMMRAAVIVESQ
uniref:B30.2/SPRY domain-containing protein n=1 Tax=Anopheles atroparvus TaxID=41427 RepID=A0A182ITP1_ANOAO